MSGLTTHTRIHRPLALAIAFLLAGPAAAEIAGKVNYVVGEVTVIDAEGHPRLLNKWDTVNSGERLETGKGRIQIRFTDGSFMSLQPGTVFRLDRYSFDRNRPEQGSLLFNFARGGMRTVSGLIGRVNKANYKVRTPVASLGIRGTGYAATLENDVLTLTVDKGIVNVSNAFGSSDVNAGQTFQVLHGGAPGPAPEGVSAEARAREPYQNGDGQVASGTPDSPAPALMPDDSRSVRGSESQPLASLLTPVTLTDSRYPPLSGQPQPAYSLGSLFVQPGNSLLLDNLGAFFQTSGADAGGLIRLAESSTTAVTPLFDTGNPATGGLQLSNAHTTDALAWGEWTNGTAANGKLDRNTGQITLAPGVFEPYIIGVASHPSTTLDAQGRAVKLSYSLQGGTTARSSDGETGTLKTLNLQVTLSAVPVVSVDLTVSMKNTGDYVVSKSGLLINNGNKSTLSGFQLQGTDLNATGQGCPTAGCAVMLAAFLAGESQMGTVYVIDRANGQISGVGALGQTGNSVSPQQLANAGSQTDAAVLVGNNTNGIIAESAISASFGPTGTWDKGILSSANESLKFGPGYSTSSPATGTNIAHVNQTLSWGQWISGMAYEGGQSPVSMNSQGIHYLIGTPTPSANLPNAKLSYSLVGGTPPTLSDSIGSPVSAGNLKTGLVTVDFGQGTSSMALGLVFGPSASPSAVSLNGSGSLTSASLGFSNLTVSVTNAGSALSTCSSCTASAGGFVASNNADMIGLGYQIKGVSVQQTVNGIISGVAGFGNPKVLVQGGTP